jgi:hypothetical protein
MYGVGLEPIEPDKPTGFALKDDIAIISLDTKATFDGDMLAEFTWSARSFDTASRKGRSPRDQYRTLTSSSQAHGASRNLRKEISNCELHEGTLATMRCEIEDVFEPPCHNDCEEPVERIDGQSYDHTQHKTCTPRKKIVLVLPNREKCLNDLKILGCDIHQGYVPMELLVLQEPR